VFIRAKPTRANCRNLGQGNKILHGYNGQGHAALDSEALDLLLGMLFQKVFHLAFAVAYAKDLKKRFLIFKGLGKIVLHNRHANLLLSNHLELLQNTRHKGLLA
jgi:hypothetical protein